MPACPPSSPITRRLVLLAAIVVLHAGCGGGGGDAAPAPSPVAPAPSPVAPAPTPVAPAPTPVAPAPTPVTPAEPVPGAPTATLVSSQASAQALVQDALRRTRDLRLASGLTAGAQASGAGGGLDLSPLLRRRALAVSDYSASLCSSGSASVEVADAVLARFTADPNAKMQPGDTIGVVTSACVIKTGGLQLGAVSLGEFGVGDRIDGRFELELLSASGSDVMFELAYTDFVYQPYGGTAFEPLDAVLRFGTEGGQEVYALEIPQTRFLEAPVVSSVRAGLLISSGSLRGKLPAASGTGYADFAYTGWSYDTTTGHAGAGSVVVSGANASQARITAGAGAYSVAITVGGSTASFSVVR